MKFTPSPELLSSIQSQTVYPLGRSVMRGGQDLIVSENVPNSSPSWLTLDEHSIPVKEMSVLKYLAHDSIVAANVSKDLPTTRQFTTHDDFVKAFREDRLFHSEKKWDDLVTDDELLDLFYTMWTENLVGRGMMYAKDLERE